MWNVILCEGGTDLALMQYFMEAANGWEYAAGNRMKEILQIPYIKQKKRLMKGNHSLLIAETGGCSNLCPCFAQLIKRLRLSSPADEITDRIIIVSDRDELGSLKHFIIDMQAVFQSYGVTFVGQLENDQWLECSIHNSLEEPVLFKVLLLIIPFEETGALETFLLGAIAEKDTYDHEIITKGKTFVNQIDPENRYLTKRRYKTKAEFDVYFSIRTPLEQFQNRRSILRNISWEDYTKVQRCFEKLSEL